MKNVFKFVVISSFLAGGASTTFALDDPLISADLPKPQLVRYEECSATADQIRQQARDMTRMAGEPGFDATMARQQKDQIQEQASSLFEVHGELMEHFGENLRELLRERTRQLDQARERVDHCLEAVAGALESESPDAGRVRAEAKQLTKAIKHWQRHYRELGYDLGVKPS